MTINRRLNPGPDPGFAAQVSILQLRIANIGNDVKLLQQTLPTLHRRDAPPETIVAIISFIAEQLNALRRALHEVKGAAPECLEILDPATTLEKEINKTVTDILEPGFIGA